MTETPLFLPGLGPIYAMVTPWIEALLRFMTGALMVPHGLRMACGKFRSTWKAPGTIAWVAQLYDGKGYRPGRLWAICTVLTQFVAAPCLALGLFTRPMAFVLFLLLLLSAVDHLAHDGWFSNQSGFEYPGLWAACALYFAASGGGPFSLDRLFKINF